MTSPEEIRCQLTARGQDDQQQSSIVVTEGQVIRIGRAPKNDWAIPWDPQISREHADVVWNKGKLKVTCTPNASNPIIFNGLRLRDFEIGFYQDFRIGMTEFKLLPISSDANPPKDVISPDMKARPRVGLNIDLSGTQPVGHRNRSPFDLPGELGLPGAANLNIDFGESSFAVGELKHAKFADPSRQMELLTNLPKIISTAEDDVGLALKLAGLLLEAIPQAVAVAVVQYDSMVIKELRQSSSDNVDLGKPAMMHVQTRDSYVGRFVPSRRLVSRALKSTESFMYIWTGDSEGVEFTMCESLNWAFCTPLAAESCTGWCLYVSGQGGKNGKQFVTTDDLKGDVRFTELLAQLIGSIRQVRVLQEQKTQLSSFFSPKVIQSLTGRIDDDILKPSERDISVMFCDVRGFSKKAEQYRDNLPELLTCVRAALSAMTGGILENDGTIADFQGDAALGFWGWPVALNEGPLPACRAALVVQEEFHRRSQDQGPLRGFSVGVGIAHGRAIAGQIGTSQQAKVGVFGPVVNQGSRLEGMTAQFGVDICVDEATVDFVRRLLPRDQGRVRKLARVRPKGMETLMMVSELLPPFGPTCSVTDEMIEQHEAAVDAITAGDWAKGLKLLEDLPDSGPKRFLLNQMAESSNQPPTDWSGAFFLEQK